MPLYVQLSLEEERTIKKAVLETMASTVSAQNTALQLLKLKKSKTMNETLNIINEIAQELEKIKQALPEPELKKSSTEKVKVPVAKTKYELELEKIREKIASLGY